MNLFSPQQFKSPAQEPDKDDVWVPSNCALCYGTCSILAHRVDGVVVNERDIDVETILQHPTDDPVFDSLPESGRVSKWMCHFGFFCPASAVCLSRASGDRQQAIGGLCCLPAPF
jgi:anaerobic selenocysteine-containing dehydrogenase